MTSLTPVIDSNYNPLASAAQQSSSFVPVDNSERPLYAQAVFDVSSAAATGQNGATFINDTNTYSGDWYAIQLLSNSNFDILDSNWDGSTSTGVVFKADHTMYGHFTRIKLSSGTVIAYKL